MSISVVTLYTYDSTLMGLFFCTTNEKIDFEENKFNERFGECSSKYPIMLCLMSKTTK